MPPSLIIIKKDAEGKEKLYRRAVADIVAAFLPVLDNIEQAVSAADEQWSEYKGRIQLIHGQILDILSNMGCKTDRSPWETLQS